MEVGSSGKVPRISQNLVLLHNVSVNNETAYMSDAGLKELSVVESDDYSDQGLETPAAYLKAQIRHGGFQDHSGLATPIEAILSGGETATPDETPDKITSKTKTRHIQVQDAENDSIVSKNTMSPQFQNQYDLATFDPQQVKEQITVGPKLKPNNNQIGYLSSNESVILAKSHLMTSMTPVNLQQIEALQSNVLDRVQKVVQKKRQQQNNVNMQSLLLPTKQSSDVIGRSPSRKQSQKVRDSDSFNYKRLSSNPVATYQRSNTKDEQVKQIQVSRIALTGSGDKQQSIVNLPRNKINAYIGSSRRMAKNMPMHSNQKAQRNHGKYNQQFVDSDFYENKSIQRGQPQAPGLTNKMRSTSPVSSQASTFLKQRSIRTRKSGLDSNILGAGGENLESNHKFSLHNESDITNKVHKQENPQIFYRRKKNTSQERDIMMIQQRTDQMVQQKEQRVMKRMYQQKFIERREKQVQIVNRRANQQSDQESKALAYAMSTRIDKQAGLDTLRKVHDSIGYERQQTKDKKIVDRGSMKHSMEYRNNQSKNRTNLTEIHHSVDSSVDEYGGTYLLPSNDKSNTTTGNNNLYDSYEQRGGNNQQIAQDNNQLKEYSLISHQQSTAGVQPSDQGFGDKQQQADYREERGGQKLTSDDSIQKTFHDYQADEQYTPPVNKKNNNLTLRSNSPQKFQKPFGNVSSTTTSRQFRVPKMRAPQKYQNVVERTYNMLQTEEDTYFLPGQASHSVYQTSVAVSQPTSTNPRSRQAKQLDAVKCEIPCDDLLAQAQDHPMSIIEQRKKSHELNSVRNKQQNDEDRIKKLTDVSMSQKIEKYRQRMSIGGRDDPSNVLGYQNLQPWQPTTIKNNRSAVRNRTAAAQLDPLKDRRVVMMVESPGLQKNINGMLDKLNRAKTMRIANQVLKEQQQQFYAVQHRREYLNSQGNNETETRQNLALFGQSPQKAPSLQIQTNMPQIPAMQEASVNQSSGLFTPQNLYVTRTQPANAMAFLATSGPPDQRKSSGAIKKNNYADLLKQMSNNSKQNDISSFGTSSKCAAKPETPLANTGLRIILTNHPSAMNNKR